MKKILTDYDNRDIKHKEEMIQLIKASGQELINRAEDIVGKADLLSDLTITFYFSPDVYNDCKIEILQTILNRQAINVKYKV